MTKDITFLIKQMSGGGAERMISLLATEFSSRGYDCTVILTHQRMADADLSRLNENVNVISLSDEAGAPAAFQAVRTLPIRVRAKFDRIFLADGKAKQLVKMYKVRNYAKYHWLKEYFAKRSDAAVVAFLYDSIFLTLLADGEKNRIIISDRGDPSQSVSSRTDMAFFKLMFKKADAVVFQSPDVSRWYKERFGIEGTVVFNPISPGLPEPHKGERRKSIVDFCRISTQKNLILLIEAFSMFYETHPDYDLDIIGDPVGNGVDGYLEKIRSLAVSKSCSDRIHIIPSNENVHREILDYAMFVSSSDSEGMSNSMLEAMAIGLPTICTDCPAGGARAVIRDHENGILTPVGDAEALCRAMCEVADDPLLARRLSENGAKIRGAQSVDKIISIWEDIING